MNFRGNNFFSVEENSKINETYMRKGETKWNRNFVALLWCALEIMKDINIKQATRHKIQHIKNIAVLNINTKES